MHLAATGGSDYVRFGTVRTSNLPVGHSEGGGGGFEVDDSQICGINSIYNL